MPFDSAHAYNVNSGAYQGAGLFDYQGSIGVPTGTGGALWAKGKLGLKLKPRRPLTHAENEELAVRLQAIAARAVVAIPMDRISDTDGHVIWDDPFDDDDDLILQAVILRILH